MTCRLARRPRSARWSGRSSSSPFASFRMLPQSAPIRKPCRTAMTTTIAENDLRAAIRTIPDYPKPGIMFRDITTLLGDARAFRRAVDELVQPWAGSKIDKVAGIEARGFILG